MKRSLSKLIIFAIIIFAFFNKFNEEISNKDSSLDSLKLYKNSTQCIGTAINNINLNTESISNQTFSANDSTELNWYYVQREPNQTPEEPSESRSFLNQNNAFYCKHTQEKILYLTFDEGYEKGYTNSILDTLKAQDVKAAFFVVKPYIDQNPDIIKRMTEEGHLVCNHSNHHPSMPSLVNSNEFTNEITDVEKTYKELTNQDMPKFFRPPMGKYSQESLKKTNDLGYTTIFWSFAYKDWLVDEQPSAEYAKEKIKKGIHPGAIILLHAVSKTNTEILPSIISDLKNEGYQFESLTEL